MKYSEAFRIVSRVAKFTGKNEDYTYTYSHILAGIMSHHDIELSAHDIADVLDDINTEFSVDFTIDCDGCEFRVIADSAIWDIYVETIKDIVTDCYDLKLDNIPAFIAVSVDWEVTATNAYVNGYGHTFSSYDGSEFLTDAGYWIFRTN